MSFEQSENGLTQASAPPMYTVRRSMKAKRIYLRISVKRGLEVIIPHWRKRFNIARILSEQKAWIEKWLQRVAISLPLAEQPFPTEMVLLATGMRFAVCFRENNRPRFKVKASIGILTLEGKNCTVTKFLHLKKWLYQQAQEILIPWLSSLSQELCVSYTRVSIRNQSTLWGSCSRQGRISLNVKLLFLPPHVVRYVLVHELCHLRYLNHSKAFWSLVARYDPQYQEHRALLKNAQSFLPAWLDA